MVLLHSHHTRSHKCTLAKAEIGLKQLFGVNDCCNDKIHISRHEETEKKTILTSRMM